MTGREPLGLEHRELLEGSLKDITSRISEYCFPNLFLYRKVHQYEVMTGDDIYLAGVSYAGHRFIMPTAPLEAAAIPGLCKAAREFDYIYPVPEESLRLFEGFDITVGHDDGDSDYIYFTSRMSLFPGRWLHKKRNLRKQFQQSYRHEAVPLTSQRLPEAERILRQWLKDSGQRAEDTDFHACLDALGLYDELILCGGIFYADGEPAGFVLGEELAPDTFLLHFAKGLTRFKGIYQYIFSSFASVLPEGYRYLNIEQDLNVQALRRSKQSYRPEMVLKKMRVAVSKED